MKTMFKAALAATVATGLFASPAFAANTAAAPFVAKATIVKPLTIVKNFDLDFGTITMGPSLNTQTVSVNQDNTTACGGTDLTCSFPTQAAATFTVTGVGTQTLLVDLGTPPTALKDAALHTVGFTVDAPTSVALTNGSGSFGIGGDIVVNSGTFDGAYSANLNVTVSYQ